MLKGLDFANVKPTLVNWAVVGLMAITFIAISKWALTKWQVPGLTALVQAV